MRRSQWEGRSKVNFQLRDAPIESAEFRGDSTSPYRRISKKRMAYARRVAENEAGAEREAVTLIRIESRCEDLDSLEAQ